MFYNSISPQYSVQFSFSYSAAKLEVRKIQFEILIFQGVIVMFFYIKVPNIQVQFAEKYLCSAVFIISKYSCAENHTIFG